MQFDHNKFRDAILYVASRCAPGNLGAVKLHKVLYFSDMLSFVGTGLPITGAVYKKRPFGPTAEALPRTITEMQASGDLGVEVVDYFGYQKKHFVALRAPRDGSLSSDESALLDEVIDFVCNENTAKTISEFSHRMPWDLAEFGDVITYESAFLLFPQEASEKALALTLSERASVEEERSNSDPLDFKTGAQFRSQFRAV